MKRGRYNFQMICIIAALLANGNILVSETPSIQWNEVAQSQIINNNELNKLEEAFPSWKIKQITWPSNTEINTKKVAVDPNLTARCMRWLEKFMKKEKLPKNLDQHLIAMKDWGLIRKKSEQKRLCDMFIARYKQMPYVVHIQESPYNVVIAVSDERLASDARSDYKDMIIETAKSILGKQLEPNINSDFHLFKLDNIKIRRAVWLTKDVATTDKNGKKCANITNAVKNGAISVKAETDGRFVKFEITKCIKGPRSHPDPYKERFGSSK